MPTAAPAAPASQRRPAAGSRSVVGAGGSAIGAASELIEPPQRPVRLDDRRETHHLAQRRQREQSCERSSQSTRSASGRETDAEKRTKGVRPRVAEHYPLAEVERQ